MNFNWKYKDILNFFLNLLKGQGAALGRPKGQGGFPIFKMRTGCSPFDALLALPLSCIKFQLPEEKIK